MALKNEESLEEEISRISAAYQAEHGAASERGPMSATDSYIVETHDDYVIVCVYGLPSSPYYRVGYVINGEAVTFASRDTWQEVERRVEWDAVVKSKRAKQPGGYVGYFGGEVKALGNGRIGGYLVRFTDPDHPDLEGDYFDKDTDFGEIRTSPVYYQHGLDPALKTRRLSNSTLGIDDIGVWIDTQLSLRDEYEKFIYGMAEAGKMGWSSGTAGHLVEREPLGGAMHIKHWPLGLDASLTPTPAEPANVASPIKGLTGKSLAELAHEAITAQEAANGEAIPAAADEQTEPEPETISNPILTAPAEVRSKEAHTMSDQDPRFDAMEAQLKAVSEALTKITGQLEQPGPDRAGYVTNIGGSADPAHKSFGDWLMAVKRGDVARLTKIYGSTKDMAGDTGTQGGFLVPEQYLPALFLSAAESPVVSRVRRIRVNSPSGHWPSPNYGVVPTAGSGQTGLAAGLSAATTEEGATLTEDQPVFVDREWRVRKIGGYVEVSNELIQDSPLAIEGLLSSLVGVTINSKNERNILRGSGAGEPIGILNAAGTIALATVTNDTFGEGDALGLVARHKNLSGQQSVWIMNSGVIPDFAAFADTSFVPLVDFVKGVSGQLLGLPIIYSEHMPQANGDDVILADLGSYMFFERGGLEIAYSAEVGFLTDKGTWRFTSRNDGFPWLQTAITEADPTGSRTVSPFLYHDD